MQNPWCIATDQYTYILIDPASWKSSVVERYILNVADGNFSKVNLYYMLKSDRLHMALYIKDFLLKHARTKLFDK